MNVGQYILRLVCPKGEDMRQELRMTMAHAHAVTEDLNRTVVLDADAIRKAIEEHQCKTTRS